MIERNWIRDGQRLKSDNLRRCNRLQDRDAVQGRSESRWRGIAHRRGRREARLARGGFRELGHEMWGPAGTGRGGVSMAGRREGQGARKGNGARGHHLPSPPCFVQNVFRLSVSMRKVASEHPFCVLIYMKFYIFHICFILFILLSYLIFDFVCLMSSLADTTHMELPNTHTHAYGIHTHTHTHTHKNKSRKSRKKREKK